MEVEIDDDCHGVLARNQPTAVDMRFLVAVMKITADLERMADSAVNIAQAARQLNREPPLKPYVDLPRISRACSRWCARASTPSSAATPSSPPASSARTTRSTSSTAASSPSSSS